MRTLLVKRERREAFRAPIIKSSIAIVISQRAPLSLPADCVHVVHRALKEKDAPRLCLLVMHHYSVTFDHNFISCNGQ